MKGQIIPSLFLLLFISLSCNVKEDIVSPEFNTDSTQSSSNINFIDTVYVSSIDVNCATITCNLISFFNDDFEIVIEYSFDSLLSDVQIYRIPVMSNDNRTELSAVIEHLSPNKQYFYSIYLKSSLYNSQKWKGYFKTKPLECKYVDLGLSVNWATYNIGAENPEGYGYYYAWGETEIKNIYNWSTFKWSKNNTLILLKYNTDSGSGYIDNKITLDPEDDIAQVLYGKDWHLPKPEEWVELQTNCSWEWTTNNNIDGWKITSSIPGFTDQFIFLPASGYMNGTKLENVGTVSCYWSNCINNNNSRLSQGLYFNPNESKLMGFDRSMGLPVRAVSDSHDWINEVAIILSEKTKQIFPDYSFKINATVKKDTSVINYPIIWKSDNPNVATVDDSGMVKGISNGTAIISASIKSVTTQCVVIVTDESDLEHNYVDLGLSVNWATVNVGATLPEDYGTYHSWCYNIENINKYNKNGQSILKLEDDVAHIKWGGNWRTPTYQELSELKYNCTWNNTSLNGVWGYLVTSNIPGYTDKSIFIPYSKNWAATAYWSSSLYKYDIHQASYLSLYSSPSFQYTGYQGKLSVRPVCSSESWIATSSITIEEDTTTLIPDITTFLHAIVSNNGIIYNNLVNWSSDNPSVASIDSEGRLKAVSSGTATITASIQSLSSQCTIIVHDESEINHKSVDLGLSVKWATCNIGATSPEQHGRYYAFGETQIKDYYDWNNYTWCEGSSTTLTKYCTNNQYGYNGYYDNKTILDSEDDAAHVLWGEEWRMPTKEEIDELLSNCTIITTSYNKNEVFMITSNNPEYKDACIFLPKVNIYEYSRYEMGYRSSSIDSYNPTRSYILSLDNKGNYITKSTNRCIGIVIRPVCP